jgi:hypothetical protein
MLYGGLPVSRRIAPLLLGLALCGPALAGQEGTRAAMVEIFEHMRTLLKLSADASRFQDPRETHTILEALREVGDQAALLADHGGDDLSAEFLAGTLERYATWALRSYEWRQPEKARQLIRDSVEVCVACHTRLPADRDSPLAQAFLGEADLAGLPPAARAHLEIATRRFDEALATLEGLLKDPATPAAELEGPLRDYLLVTLRVRSDPARARQGLERLAGRTDLPASLVERLGHWRRSLADLEIHPSAADPLGRARALIAAGENPAFPDEASALVPHVAASAVLHRHLAASPSPAGKAEAWYLLGLSEYRLGPDSDIPKTELYLEQSILTDPQGAYAIPAYRLLEGKVREVYGSGPERRLPDEVAEHLAMLARLVGAD